MATSSDINNKMALQNCAKSIARVIVRCLPFALLGLPLMAAAQQAGLPALTSVPTAGGGQTYTLSLQTLLLLTALSMLPAALLMMTSFTRIIIVLGLSPPGTRHPAASAQPGAHGAGIVHDLHRDGPHIPACE